VAIWCQYKKLWPRVPYSSRSLATSSCLGVRQDWGLELRCDTRIVRSELHRQPTNPERLPLFTSSPLRSAQIWTPSPRVVNSIKILSIFLARWGLYNFGVCTIKIWFRSGPFSLGFSRLLREWVERIWDFNKNHAKLGEFESLCVVVILSSVDLVCLGVV
jgi:hypothetical protein